MNTLEMPVFVDLDTAIDQAILFVRADAVIGLLDELAGTKEIPVDPYLFRDARTYLAHEMVEENHRHELDSLTHLELRCRKEEIRRKLVRHVATAEPIVRRNAA